MKKIALCLGGETRIFHKYVDRFLDLQAEFAKHDIQLDLYGHTWAHCDINFDTSIFKQFVVEDQKVIDEWVAGDIIKRAHYNPNNVISYSDTFVDDVFAQARSVYGQLFSGIGALQLPGNGYDMYVRARWDTIPKGGVDLAILKHNLTSPAVYTTDNKISSMYADNVFNFKINDTVFALTPMATDAILNTSITTTLDKVMSLYPTGSSRPRDHDLWTRYLAQSSLDIRHGQIAPFRLTRE